MPELPSKQEIQGVAERALELVGERTPNPMGHGPGYLSTATALYSLAGRKQVRVSTIEDWGGNDPMPDMMVLLHEGHGEAEVGRNPALETGYSFMGIGFFRRRYSINVSRSEVVVDDEGRYISSIPISGYSAVLGLTLSSSLTKQERKLFKQFAAENFDTTALASLANILESCGPHNRIPYEPDETRYL